MKSLFSLIIILQFCIMGTCQKMDFYVAHVTNQTVTKQQLNDAKTLNDFYPKFEKSWVRSYESVAITAVNDGKSNTIVSDSDNLNQQQMTLLRFADSYTNVEVVVKYIPENTLKNNNELKELSFTLNVLPNTEASYVGGMSEVENYIIDNIINPIKSDSKMSLDDSEIIIHIDKIGAPSIKSISVLPHDESVVDLINKAICDMPKWIPAKDENNSHLHQEFVLKAGNSNVGCLRSLPSDMLLLQSVVL